jgi:hypothetical protein
MAYFGWLNINETKCNIYIFFKFIELYWLTDRITIINKNICEKSCVIIIHMRHLSNLYNDMQSINFVVARTRLVSGEQHRCVDKRMKGWSSVDDWWFSQQHLAAGIQAAWEELVRNAMLKIWRQVFFLWTFFFLVVDLVPCAWYRRMLLERFMKAVQGMCGSLADCLHGLSY